ncbi:MAG TPA: hypothetical protein VJ875_13230 [Pyrinomonadaceae bacterium]|nr:hypothetical protein [Pyrinomonadaceae bacterium]
MERPNKSLRRVLEVSANLGIVIVALIVVGNFVASKWGTKREIDTLTTGSKVSLSGVKWEDGTTLVLALQRGCRFCEESAPFYRRLWQQRSGSEPRMIAVVPGEKAQVGKYLNELGVVVDGIVNASLADIHVSATPTLVLVDRSGRVSNVWVGKLDSNTENDVIQRAFNPH